MIDLSDYIYESILDDVSTLSKENLKAMISPIKEWTKTVKKTGGRIKVDSKTGKVTLPDNHITISNMNYEFPQGISFADFKPTNLTLWWQTGEDIMKILAHTKSGDVKIYDPKDLTVFDVPLDVYSLRMDLSDDLKFTDKVSIGGIDIQKLGSAKKNISISGLKNICVEGKTGISLRSVNCVDPFGEIKTINELYCNNVNGPSDLFKNLKYAKDITVTNCSVFDFSRCECDKFRISGIDGSYDFKKLPKKFEALYIASEKDLNEFDLSFINDENIKVYFNSDRITLGDSEANDIINEFNKLKQRGSHIETLSDKFINYFKQNSTPAKYNVDKYERIETNEKGICIFIDGGGEGNGEYSRIMYFDNGKCKEVFKYKVDDYGPGAKPKAWSAAIMYNDVGTDTGSYSHPQDNILALKLNDKAARTIQSVLGYTK